MHNALVYQKVCNVDVKWPQIDMILCPVMMSLMFSLISVLGDKATGYIIPLNNFTFENLVS